MMRAMGLSSLLLSRDAEAVRILSRTLHDYGVRVLTTNEPEEAAGMLARRKFDAFVVDCDDLPGAGGVLEELRRGASNRNTIVLALTNGATSVRRAFELGANFVLDKPFTADRAARSFRAAHGLMVRERRRYYRCSVNVPVALDLGDGLPHQFYATNLSEGGLALNATRKLPVGKAMKVCFNVPECRIPIEAKAEIAWANEDGRAGVRFLAMNEASRLTLSKYLALSLERSDPIAAVSNGRSNAGLRA